MGPAIGRREFPAGAKVRAAVLKGIAGVMQVLDAFIEWNHARDFLAHFPACFATEQMRAVRADRGGQFAQDFPLGARLADETRNFGTEHDAALRAGLGAAVVLLIARLG